MLPITKKHISRNYSVGRVITPKYLVIHETGNTGVGANALAHYNYWNTNDAAQASTHFVVDDHTIVQMLELNERAWHVGDNDGSHSDITNSNAIGIEICVNSDGNYTAARANAIDLAAYVMKTLGFGMDKLKRHYDASGKHCPNNMLNNPSLWTEFVGAVSSQIGGSAPTPSNTTSYLKQGDSGQPVIDLQTKLNKCGYNYNLATDGSFGPATLAAVKDFQAKAGLTVDGFVGTATWTAIDKRIADLSAPKVLYRVILDGVQKMALSSQEDAITAVKDAVDGGQATAGKVQRNTDNVDVFTYTKPIPTPPQPTVLYRVILDGKQIEALSSQENAIAEVKNAVDSGKATTGKVQRNTDSVDIFTYTKPIPTPEPDPIPEPVPEPIPQPTPVQIVKHPLMGQPEVSPEQMAQFLLKRNASPSIDVPAMEFAKMFLEEGAIEGIRGDLAFCQSIHETGYFRFGGQVLPEQHNYAGIGATNNSAVGKGAWFNTAREGIRAQIQHLKAYASSAPLVNPCIDPRYSLVTKGIAPTLEDLAGRWAVPGYSTSTYSSMDEALIAGQTYGQLIYQLIGQIRQEVIVVVPPIIIPPTPVSITPYHVNKTFGDMLGEVGTYDDINDAKIAADNHRGYVVFDNQGNVVYGSQLQARGIVNTGTLNVRSIPLIGDNTIIGVLHINQAVEIFSVKDGWMTISYNNKTAYVKAEYVRVL